LRLLDKVGLWGWNPMMSTTPLAYKEPEMLFLSFEIVATIALLSSQLALHIGGRLRREPRFDVRKSLLWARIEPARLAAVPSKLAA
jgi:hypothetical protein